MITLDLPPQTEQALIEKAQIVGMSVESYLLNYIEQLAKPSYAKGDDEQAYYDWFYRHHFDTEKMKQAVGETDENGRAKNTHTVPNWALTDLASFDKWLAV